MGISTVCFVTCGKDKMYEVGNAVTKELNKWIREELDKQWITKHQFINRIQYLMYLRDNGLNPWTNGCSMHMYDFDCIVFDFSCGENHNLYMSTNCVNDHSNIYEGDKIIFSLGCRGRSEEIIDVVAKAIRDFGDVYIDYNDCDNVDFATV